MGNPRRLYTKTGPIRFPNVCKTPSLAPKHDRLYVGSVEVGNGSAAAMRVGWGYELPDVDWIAGYSTLTTFTDDTTDAQDAGTGDFMLANKDVANSGFVVAAKTPFNLIGVTLATAAATAGTVYYQYSNGTAFSNLTTVTTGAMNATPGDIYFMFLKPHDFAPFTTAVNGVPAGNYAFRAVFSTAPTTTSPLATELWVCNLVDYVESCDAGKSILWDSGGDVRIPGNLGIVAYAATADAENWINIEYTEGP